MYDGLTVPQLVILTSARSHSSLGLRIYPGGRGPESYAWGTMSAFSSFWYPAPGSSSEKWDLPNTSIVLKDGTNVFKVRR